MFIKKYHNVGTFSHTVELKRYEDWRVQLRIQKLLGMHVRERGSQTSALCEVD